MALSDDQRAMLRLLAERGEEGYDDIAALKGVSVEQVKKEMKAALAAAAAEQEPAPVAKDPEPDKPATAPEREEPPPASSPLPPQPTPPAPGRSAPSPGKARLRVGGSLPPGRRRLVMVAAGALAVVAFVLILIALIGGTSGGSSSGEAASTPGTESEAGAKLTQAELQPVSGQRGEGRAVFGRVGSKEIVLQVAAQGLDPNTAGQSYTVWLYRSPKIALRVGSVKVGKSGKLGVQLPIPAELLAYVVSGAFKQIYLSRISDTAYEREVAQAKKQKQLPPYSGETVLTGEITGPTVKAAAGKEASSPE
ncbi:MAG: hypothetical protein WBM00_05345 [Solirubrobacterales bacterium]